MHSTSDMTHTLLLCFLFLQSTDFLRCPHGTQGTLSSPQARHLHMASCGLGISGKPLVPMTHLRSVGWKVVQIWMLIQVTSSPGTFPGWCCVAATKEMTRHRSVGLNYGSLPVLISLGLTV